jgi:hypothetical protein
VDIDTGSNKLILLDSSCTDCQGTTFNSGASSTYVDLGIEDSIAYLDNSWIFGSKSTETVRFTSTSSYGATNFNFLLGFEQEGFEDYNGLLGLTRYVDTEYDMIVDQLYKQDKLSSRVFAFYMASNFYQSTLQLGGYDESYIRLYSGGLQYIPLADSEMFWDVQVDAVMVGTEEFSQDGKIMGWQFDQG